MGWLVGADAENRRTVTDEEVVAPGCKNKKRRVDANKLFFDGSKGGVVLLPGHAVEDLGSGFLSENSLDVLIRTKASRKAVRGMTASSTSFAPCDDLCGMSEYHA